MDVLGPGAITPDPSPLTRLSEKLTQTTSPSLNFSLSAATCFLKQEQQDAKLKKVDLGSNDIEQLDKTCLTPCAVRTTSGEATLKDTLEHIIKLCKARQSSKAMW